MRRIRSILFYSLVVGSALLIPTYFLANANFQPWIIFYWQLGIELTWIAIAIGWNVFAGSAYIAAAKPIRLLVDLVSISIVSLVIWLIWLSIIDLGLGCNLGQGCRDLQIWLTTTTGPDLWQMTKFWLHQTLRLLIVSYITLLVCHWLNARNRWTGQPTR